MVVDRVRALFRERFGGEPRTVARAPGRVNLIGEHVDYADGVVLPMAIERDTAVAMRAASGRSTIVSDRAGEAAFDLRAQESPLPDRAWANYALGPMRELIARGIGGTNVDVAIASDVPVGGGVSSSAALEVSVAVAYAALHGARPEECGALDGVGIARLCQRAEWRFAGTPCGIMDMMVSASARAGHAMLLDCRTLEVRHLPMPADATVLVVDSGVRHRLSDGGYAARRCAVETAAQRLGVLALRDATVADVKASGLGEPERSAALHVTTEIERTIAAGDALRTGDLTRFGRLMCESHASLRDRFRVSVSEIDTIVDAACACSGVFGARLTGGGFGGCAIALVERPRVRHAVATVVDRFARRFGRRPASFATGAGAGAGVVAS